MMKKMCGRVQLSVRRGETGGEKKVNRNVKKNKQKKKTEIAERCLFRGTNTCSLGLSDMALWQIFQHDMSLLSNKRLFHSIELHHTAPLLMIFLQQHTLL